MSNNSSTNHDNKQKTITEERLIQQADPLFLDLPDYEFADVLDMRIKDSVSYYSGKNLYERQEKLRSYYVGDQGDATNEKKLPKYANPYLENVIHEGIIRQKPIALSRLPDMVVKAGDGGDVSRDSAEALTDLLNSDMKRRDRRRLLGRAFKEQPLNFYSVIKARWNDAEGFDGDYQFVNIHPDNIVWDHTCKTSDVDDMFFVAEKAEFTVKEILMMFPKAQEEFLTEIGLDNDEKRTQKEMASKYEVWEVWFHWYKEKKDEVTGQTKYEKIHAVAWKFRHVILGKMRNPYYDYEGRINLFDIKKEEKKELTDEDIYEAMFGNNEISKTYHNYFKQPRKPYFFMTYENMGEDPIDITTRVEQTILFQDHINLEGLQISEMNARTVGKPIINSQFIDKKEAKKIDWKDHNQAVTVNADDVRKAFSHIPGIPAPTQLYNSKQQNRNYAFEMIGVNATTRGLREEDSTLGQDQMAREADYGLIDDIVEETINAAGEWIGQWSMQLIKMFYTKPHYKDAVGKDGESLYMAISQDMVDDGMVVEVGASGVDKVQRKRLAMQNMQAQAGDLLSYYEDTDQSNPKERARRAFMFQNAPMMYYQMYLADEKPVVPGQEGLPQEQDPVMANMQAQQAAAQTQPGIPQPPQA